ncbi:odorant receptor 33a-like isoform X1 [Microplitis mediator]|uniref:odorant receptor 33a-like isoform X1 n=1 Tax=Microplitis mediator TaxID=375433 RepID=UPI002555E73F|nr:odorant receptor 33a-like isoform X1 [Microplitis mediator]
MEVLKFNFCLLSIMGVWKPRGWRGIKAIFYYIYRSFVVINILNLLVSCILDIRLKNVQLDTFVDNISLTFAWVIARQKVFCVIENRCGITRIIDSLEKYPFKLRDYREELIFQRFRKFARTIFTYYPVLFISSLLTDSFGHMSVMDPPYALPYPGWVPYNYSRTTQIYWGTVIYQVYAILTSGTVNLILDLLLPCMMCYMCGHIHILRHRFQVITEKLQIMSENNKPQKEIITTERKMIAEWVENHRDILNLVKFINNTFEKVIFVQYTVSSLLLCTIAFLLSHAEPGTVKFAGNLAFFATMFFQILLPCYCADKLTYEFLDISTTIYDTNWYHLSSNARKSVVIIIRQSYRPVMITSSFFIVLSLESFTKVIKLAYTIYNVLQ